MFVQDGIGYGTYTKAAIYTDPAALSNPKDSPYKDSSSSEWASWGHNNDEPCKIADDIANCGVLSAAVETEARLAVGMSVDPFLMVDKSADGTETLEYVSDPEVNDFFEANQSYEYSYRDIYNTLGYGWGAGQFLLNGGRNKISRIIATDVHIARLAKRDKKTGLMPYMYLCHDWEGAASTFDPDLMKKVPLLEEGWELEQLRQTSGGYEFAMLHRILKNGRVYYPAPLHRSAKAWIAISRSVPAIKSAINKNQMLIKYLVMIADTYWTRIVPEWRSLAPDKQKAKVDEVYDKIDAWLTGEVNAGKSIIAGRCFDPISKQFVNDITIEVLDDKMKEGKMLPDSAAADKQILFSMFFNPAIWGGNLLGDGASGGAGSGSDIREATLVLLNLLNPERQNNLKIFNLVKKFNGWDKRLEKQRDVFAITDTTGTKTMKKITPRLVFRYSNAILTTLDKGKSTQNVTT